MENRIRGTHHGVSGKHLQAYLDEFAFRFNPRRTPLGGRPGPSGPILQQPV
jgi:hypothetical protein